MSCCRWTTALGRPVVPELYSQKHMSSLIVSAGESWSEGPPVISARPSSPEAAPPITTRWRGCRDLRRALLSRIATGPGAAPKVVRHAHPVYRALSAGGVWLAG